MKRIMKNLIMHRERAGLVPCRCGGAPRRYGTVGRSVGNRRVSPGRRYAYRTCRRIKIDAVALIGNKRELLAFTLTKKRRVRTAVILGALWVTTFALMVFLLPYLKWYSENTWDVRYAYRMCYGTIHPAFYGLTMAFFASLLAIRGDFRIESRAFRTVLLVLGFVWIVFYGCFIGPLPLSMFIYDHFGLFGVWLWENPALLSFPARCFSAGLIGNRPRNGANNARVTRGDAITSTVPNKKSAGDLNAGALLLCFSTLSARAGACGRRGYTRTRRKENRW